MYVVRKGWKPEEAKSVLATCFVMTGVMISLGQLLADVHNMETLAGYLADCPGALLGGMVGLMLSKNNLQRVYQKGILLLVLLSGVHIITTSL